MINYKFHMEVEYRIKAYCQRCGKKATWISGGGNTLCHKCEILWRKFDKGDNFGIGKKWDIVFVKFLARGKKPRGIK